MRSVTSLAMLALVTMIPQGAQGQSASGDWWGALEIAPASRLRLAVHVTAGADGKLSGTLDSLDQNAMGLPLADITVSGSHLTFRLTTPPARFNGRWDAATATWRGEWQQNGRSWPLALATGQPPAADLPNRQPIPSANRAPPSDAKIAKLLDARIAPLPGAGIVVGVLDHGAARIIARGASGTTAPLGGRTIFEIGSMSKVFTALILADMAAKGEVSLDDPAEKYLPPEAKMPSRDGRSITLRDLATHTSGLPRLPDNMPMSKPDDPYADYTEEMLLDFLGHYRLARGIGERFEYSNLGFGLLGYLLARAARTDYPVLLAQRITGPLGMRDTTIALSSEQRARFAQGHDQYMRPTSPWSLPTLAGAGAIRSTAADMLIFLRATMDPNSPIAPAMKLATTGRRPIAGSGTEIGLGWIIGTPAKGHEILSHSGGTGGFRTAMVLEPAKRRGIVVLSNEAVEPAPDDLAMHLLLGSPLLSPARLPPTPPAAPPAFVAVTLSPKELDRVAGRYEFTPGVVLTVARGGTGLKARLTGQATFPIFAEAPLKFFWRVVDAQAKFVAAPDGHVTGVLLTQDGKTLQGQRIAP